MIERRYPGDLKLDYDELQAITDKWGYLRQIYMEATPDIRAAE